MQASVLRYCRLELRSVITLRACSPTEPARQTHGHGERKPVGAFSRMKVMAFFPAGNNSSVGRQLNRHIGGQPRTEPFRSGLSGIEMDAHRNTLHDAGEIGCGRLEGQQREFGARAWRKAFDL